METSRTISDHDAFYYAMSKVRPKNWMPYGKWRACNNKRRHMTKISAETEAKRINTTPGIFRHPVKAYSCDCGGWHVGAS